MLEATVIILDNSEYMRNGDYSPTRLEAQNDAVQLLTNAKLNANVENAVSIMTMGGPKVMVTLTSDQGKLLHALNSVPYEGSSINLKSAVQVAQLVLKHRQNGNQHQRIVAFVGSPLGLQKEDCLALNKILRKNNIAIDVVSFGPVPENDPALEALIGGEDGALNQEGEDENHIVRVFQGQGSIVETISATPVVRGENAAGGAGGATGGAGFEFGVDPEMDPELAMALKLSMEEEMARQAKAGGQQEEPSAPHTEEGNNGMDVDEEDEDEEALLQQAIALSMQEQQQSKPK